MAWTNDRIDASSSLVNVCRQSNADVHSPGIQHRLGTRKPEKSIRRRSKGEGNGYYGQMHVERNGKRYSTKRKDMDME